MSTASASTAKLQRANRFLEMDPTNLNLLKDAAEAHFELGEFPAANEVLGRALAIAPDNQQLLNLQGIVALASNNIPVARESFQRLVDAGVTAPAVRYNLAYALTLSGDHAPIPDLLADALEIADQVPGAPALRVRALHFLGRLDEAIALGLAQLERHPDDAVVCELLSTLYTDESNPSLALVYAEKAIAGNPRLPEAWVTRGTMRLAQQDLDAAYSDFNEALALNPASGRANLGRGMAHILASRFSDAIVDLKNATVHMPEHIGSWHALGWAKLFDDNIAEAKAAFEHGLELNRNFSESHGAIALISVLQGDRVEAAKSIKRALGLDPHNMTGRFAQALLLNSEGNTAAGQSIVKTLLATKTIDGLSLSDLIVGHMNRKK